MAKTKYLEFVTYGEIVAKADELYATDRFNEEYENNPNRMTPEQIKALGHDSMRSELWTKFIDARCEYIRQRCLEESAKAVNQIAAAIRNTIPNLATEVAEGWINRYSEPHCHYARIIVGDSNGEHMTITPTLSISDTNYFVIRKETKYADNECHCSDEELLNELQGFYNYIVCGAVPNTCINKMHHQYGNQYRLEYGGNAISLYDVEMMQLYHTLAKESNEKFGTDFPFSQATIDRLWKHAVFGNIQYVGRFELSGSERWGYELHQIYFYEDDDTHKPDFKCTATYGYVSKEEVVCLLNALRPYALSDYFADTSRHALTEQYDKYDAMHIGYDERPCYFQDLVYVK